MVPSAHRHHRHTPTFTDPPKDKPPRHRSGGGGWLRDVQAQIQGDTHQHTQPSCHPCPGSTTEEANAHRGQPRHPTEGCSWHTPTRPEVQRVKPPTSHLECTLEDCQEGWGSWQAVFSPSLPSPTPEHLSARGGSLMLRRGLWLLCSMQCVICPFPRLSSVPSGQYLGGIR